MTAEVAVLNAHAVALATDSAVTAGGKIYTSANKLFALSKYRPVGIMVYNSARFMSVPIEAIIKVYRQQLGKDSFDTLPEYASDFVAFLKSIK